MPICSRSGVLSRWDLRPQAARLQAGRMAVQALRRLRPAQSVPAIVPQLGRDVNAALMRRGRALTGGDVCARMERFSARRFRPTRRWEVNSNSEIDGYA
jgi:hypothetical protein